MHKKINREKRPEKCQTSCNGISRLHPQATSSIGTSTDSPRLAGVPVDIQDTQLASNLVALENLERHNGSIAEHISSNAAVEDLQGSIVGGIREERVAAAGVELDGTNGLFVVAKGLVRTLREIEIVPKQPAIIRTNNDVVAA